MTATVLFIQGGGEGAHDEDALLAEDLGRRLGADAHVEFPRMPDEGDPDFATWGPAIGDAIAAAGSPVLLVGHSIGAYLLLKQLVTHRPEVEVRALCLIAAPFPSGDADWTFDGFDLPPGWPSRLPEGVAVFLYASEDDEVVPFAHRDMYAAAIPRAVARTTTGGHQLGNDLHLVAGDIRAVLSQPKGPAQAS